MATNTSTPFRLLDLPVEIRAQIYKHAFTRDSPLIIYAKVRTNDTVSMHHRQYNHPAALTQVSHQVRIEALPTFYSTMYFSVNSWALLNAWLKKLSAAQYDLLNNLEIETTGSMDPVSDPRDRRSVVEHFAATYRKQMRELGVREPRVVEIVQSRTGERMMWLRGRSGLVRAWE